MEKAIESLEELLKLLEKEISEKNEISDFGKGYIFGIRACIKKLVYQNEKEGD